MPRGKGKSYDLPDEIADDIILISKHGCIFTVDRVTNRVVKLPKASNSKAHLLKERAPAGDRAQVRTKPNTKRVPQYAIIHYFKGNRMGGGTLLMTIDELRAQGVKILKIPGIKKRIKYSLAVQTLCELTSSREYTG